MTHTRAETLERLDRAGRRVEERVRPDRTFEGWDGRDVLCHLAGYARVVGAILQATSEARTATDTELYGRELSTQEKAMTDLDEINAAAQRETAALSYAEALAFWRAMHANARAGLSSLSDAQLAAPGPSSPAHWYRPHVAEVVTALTDHYAAHMAADESPPSPE